MALQTSGAISLNDIHIEAGGSSGTQVTTNDADVRGLINKSSGAQMSFNEWYGASAVQRVSYQWPNAGTGTADTLYTASSTDFAFGSSTDFTVEFWWRPAVNNRWMHILDQQYFSAGFSLWQNPYGQLEAYFSNQFYFQSSSALSGNTWYHVAVVRNGTGSSCHKMWINGTQVGSAGNFTFPTSALPFRIGSFYNPSSYNPQGYMSNLRVVKGTAVYTTTNFSKPTSPLTAIPNTMLLAMNTSTFSADGSGRGNTLSKGGTVNLSTTVHPF